MPEISPHQLEKFAFILKTIAHPARLSVVRILGEEDSMTVNELCEQLDCEQSMMSHHLSNMKLKGLLSSRKEGKYMHYSLKERDLLKLFDCLENCNCNFVK